MSSLSPEGSERRKGKPKKIKKKGLFRGKIKGPTGPHEITKKLISDQEAFRESVLLQSFEDAEELSRQLLPKLTNKTKKIYEAQMELMKRSVVFKMDHLKLYKRLLSRSLDASEKVDFLMEAIMYHLKHGKDQDAYEYLTGQLEMLPFKNSFKCHRLAARISWALSDVSDTLFSRKRWQSRAELHYKNALELNNDDLELIQENASFVIELGSNVNDKIKSTE